MKKLIPATAIVIDDQPLLSGALIRYREELETQAEDLAFSVRRALDEGAPSLELDGKRQTPIEVVERIAAICRTTNRLNELGVQLLRARTQLDREESALNLATLFNDPEDYQLVLTAVERREAKSGKQTGMGMVLAAVRTCHPGGLGQ